MTECFQLPLHCCAVGLYFPLPLEWNTYVIYSWKGRAGFLECFLQEGKARFSGLTSLDGKTLISNCAIVTFQKYHFSFLTTRLMCCRY